MSPLRLLILLSLVLGVSFIGLTPPTAHAADITVTTTADELNNDGDCSLREAIQAANFNIAVDACLAGQDAFTDDIDVPVGTYLLTLTGSGEDANLTGDFDILDNAASDDLHIQQVGSGSITINGNALDRIFHIHSGADVSFDNTNFITITNGQADNGGAILNQGKLYFEYAYITASLATNAGGGIYNSGTLAGDVYILQSQASQGGGIYNSGTLEMNSSLENNQADKGGGLFNTGTVNIFATQSFFFAHNNIATTQGGAIFNTGASASAHIQINALQNNTASNGGAIYNESGNMWLQGSHIYENTATQNGGAIFNAVGATLLIEDFDLFSDNISINGAGLYNQGTATLDHVVWWNSEANADGGGVYNQGTLTLMGGTEIGISYAQRGGGVFNDHGNIVFLDGTMYANNASQAGGGLYNLGGTLTGDFFIASENNAPDGGGIYNTGTIDFDSGFNMIYANSATRGGGLFNNGGTVDFESVDIFENSTTQAGGGIYNASGTIIMSNASILSNTATAEGGAVYNANNMLNAVSITDSCIVNNSDTAFFNATSQIQNATNNWWGRVDGAGPVAAGSGDTVSINVDTSGFKTVKPSGSSCPNRTTPSPTITPTPTNTPLPPTFTFTPTDTPIPPTLTFTPSNTPIPPTDTLVPPTNTPIPLTDTPIPPTDTPVPPTDTLIPATDTPAPTTDTAIPPTLTFTPSNTPIPPTFTFTAVPPTLTPSLTACVRVATAPTLISPVHRAHTTDRTPQFRWSNVSGAQSYRLMVYLEDRSFEYKKRVFVNSYTLQASEALVPAKYLWRVRTQDATCSTWSTWSQRNTLFVD